mgnify:CR=1 FL=1
MKIIGTIGSIKKNTNKLLSATFSDWSAVREGSFIKFDGDSNFHIVSHTEQKTYLKDFVLVSSNVLKVNEDCGVNINEGDSLKISYKERELSAVYKIISSGRGYKIGDHLTLGGGVPSLNIIDHTLNTTTFNVVRIGEKGEIAELNIISKGKYIEVPNNITELKGGNGNNASIEVGFKLTDHRSFVERDVQKIEFKEAGTFVYLVYGLFEGIKDGKLSIDKWEITFNSDYVGENKTNQSFQLVRDFTPNYKIPLIAKNSQNPESSVNHGFAVLDKKIAELEEKIKKLENAKN